MHLRYFCLTNTHREENKMSNSKNGYELRTELLRMAVGILESRDRRKFENEHLKSEGVRHAVDPYSTDDVLVEAERLYSFVQKK